MNEKREDRITCVECKKELKDRDWVLICNCCDRTYCEDCTRPPLVVMRAFKTRVGLIQDLFRQWLAARPERLTER
jgi:hypothetical protein